MDDYWDDLVRAERGAQFCRAEEAATSSGGMVFEIGSPPKAVSEPLIITREIFNHHIEKASNLGHTAGFDEGWAKASVRWSKRKRLMEKLIRRLWWTVVAMAAGCAFSLWAWIFTR